MGEIKVIQDNKTSYTIDAISLDDVDRASIFIVYIRNFLNMTKGMI